MKKCILNSLVIYIQYVTIVYYTDTYSAFTVHLEGGTIEEQSTLNSALINDTWNCDTWPNISSMGTQGKSIFSTELSFFMFIINSN